MLCAWSSGGYVAGSQGRIALPGEDFQFIHPDPNKRIQVIAINGSGLAGGQFQGSPALQRLGGEPTLLASVKGYVTGLNNNGQVMGIATPLGETKAKNFVWAESTGMRFIPSSEDLGIPKLSDRGWIAGGIPFAGNAGVWQPGKGRFNIHMPGADTSYVADINAQGLVIGTVDITGPGDHNPFIWSEASGMVNLTSRCINIPAHVRLISARAINNAGFVLIDGTDQRGPSRVGVSFIATPVPETSTVASLFFLVIFGSFCRRLHRNPLLTKPI